MTSDSRPPSVVQKCWVCGTTAQGEGLGPVECSMGHKPATMQPDPPTDWRTLPVSQESVDYVHENVRCACGHEPFRHYDMTGFCLDCLEDDPPCEEFRDAP